MKSEATFGVVFNDNITLPSVSLIRFIFDTWYVHNVCIYGLYNIIKCLRYASNAISAFRTDRGFTQSKSKERLQYIVGFCIIFSKTCFGRDVKNKNKNWNSTY